MTDHDQSSGRIAGVDYGTKRIGVAITDVDQTMAGPLDQYTRGDATADANYFQRLVQQEDITRFVVGLPVHLSGHESEKSLESRRFADWLREATGLPVDLFDERFTTAQAEGALLAGELTSKQRKARRDMLAAQFLLSAYLDARRGRQEHNDPLDD